MKLTIAGIDRTAEWEAELRREADARVAAAELPLPWSLDARSLGDAATEEEYLDRFLDQARRKAHVDTIRFDIARRPGLLGGLLFRVRTFLWKLLRYQHDRNIFRQNLVNSQTISALEFERDQLRTSIARLEARVEALERRHPSDRSDA